MCVCVCVCVCVWCVCLSVCVTPPLDIGLRNVLRAKQNTGLPQQLARAGETDKGGPITRHGEIKQRKNWVAQVGLNICDYNSLYRERETKGGNKEKNNTGKLTLRITSSHLTPVFSDVH